MCFGLGYSTRTVGQLISTWKIVVENLNVNGSGGRIHFLTLWLVRKQRYSVPFNNAKQGPPFFYQRYCSEIQLVGLNPDCRTPSPLDPNLSLVSAKRLIT